jgi:hypothetical protein
VPYSVRAGVGGTPAPARLWPATPAAGPLAARVGLEVERPELVDADDHLRVAVQDVLGAVHQAVQVQHAVLLGLVVGVARLLPGLQALKRHPLLAEQEPQALVADVVDHPLGDQVENGRSWSCGRLSASFLIRWRWARVNVGGRPPR